MPEFGKGQRYKCIKPDDHGTKSDISRVIGKTDEIRQGFPEKNHSPCNHTSRNKQRGTQGIIYILFEFLALHKPEISSFESKEDQGIQKWNNRIDQAHFAIINRASELKCEVRR